MDSVEHLVTKASTNHITTSIAKAIANVNRTIFLITCTVGAINYLEMCNYFVSNVRSFRCRQVVNDQLSNNWKLANLLVMCTMFAIERWSSINYQIVEMCRFGTRCNTDPRRHIATPTRGDALQHPLAAPHCNTDVKNQKTIATRFAKQRPSVT